MGKKLGAGRQLTTNTEVGHKASYPNPGSASAKSIAALEMNRIKNDRDAMAKSGPLSVSIKEGKRNQQEQSCG